MVELQHKKHNDSNNLYSLFLDLFKKIAYIFMQYKMNSNLIKRELVIYLCFKSLIFQYLPFF